jgi:signal transduction histidine kinase
LNAWLTERFERNPRRYTIAGIAFAFAFAVLIPFGFAAGAAGYYFGLSPGETLVLAAGSVTGSLLATCVTLVRIRADLALLFAWYDQPSEAQRARLTSFVFDGPRRAMWRTMAIALPFSPIGAVLLGTLGDYDSVLDLIGIELAGFVAVTLVGFTGYLLVEFIARPVREALAPERLDTMGAGAGIATQLIGAVGAVIAGAGIGIGVLTTTRSDEGATHLLVILAVDVGIVALTGVIVFLLFTTALLGPIQRLIAGTRAVGAGALDTRVPVTVGNELGELATSFNQMVADLQHANDELRATQARIVAANDAGRRQVERDLHDGAQQSLMLLNLKLGAAERAIAQDPVKSAALIAETRADLQRALEELRNLAHGIYPAVLESEGLPGALAEAASGAAIETTVSTNGAGRYPPELETAIYFCCLEALQNAGKHAGANAHASVALHEEDGALRFEVVDDGAGYDAASTEPSSGLQNMQDRIGALGGTLTVESQPGTGTRVTGRVPLA